MSSCARHSWEVGDLHMQSSGAGPELLTSTMKHGVPTMWTTTTQSWPLTWQHKHFLTTCWTSPTSRRSLPKTSASCCQGGMWQRRHGHQRNFKLLSSIQKHRTSERNRMEMRSRTRILSWMRLLHLQPRRSVEDTRWSRPGLWERIQEREEQQSERHSGKDITSARLAKVASGLSTVWGPATPFQTWIIYIMSSSVSACPRSTSTIPSAGSAQSPRLTQIRTLMPPPRCPLQWSRFWSEGQRCPVSAPSGERSSYRNRDNRTSVPK